MDGKSFGSTSPEACKKYASDELKKERRINDTLTKETYRLIC
jgi:hypothetical protein